MELFDYNIKPKKILSLHTFQDWHKHTVEIARELEAEEITVYMTEDGPVNFYRLGNPKAGINVLIKGGHEDEFTYLPSIILMMASLLRNTDAISQLLSKIQLWFIECDDPTGFNMRAWTAVNADGEECHWPPERFSIYGEHQFHSVHPIVKDIARCTVGDWRDENGVYGDKIQSERIHNILDVIDTEIGHDLDVVIDLHATYRGRGAYEFYSGAGILEIGHYPIPERIQDRIYDIYKSKKPYTAMGFWSILGRCRRLIQDNIGYMLGQAMMDNVTARGQKAYGGEFQKMLEQPTIFSQLVPVNTGRTIMGHLYKRGKIRVCPEYLKEKYCCLGYTTETFIGNSWDAILQNMAYVEGGLIHIMRTW